MHFYVQYSYYENKSARYMASALYSVRKFAPDGGNEMTVRTMHSSTHVHFYIMHLAPSNLIRCNFDACLRTQQNC